MMQKGSSEPWSKVLYELTDGRADHIDPQSILEYFKPLYEWLLKQNLTDIDWKCDEFFDDVDNSVRSYGEIFMSSKSTNLHKFSSLALNALLILFSCFFISY